MKSFKSLVSEVSQPKPEEEKRFKDQHKVDIAPHPTATEFQHKGTIKSKAKRKADQEGDSNYDAAYGVNEETEELDELSKKTLGSYVKKATGDAVTKAYRAGDVRDKDSGKNYMKALGRQIGISKATSKLTKEEVEQLDELSPNTLHSYIKKAAGNMAGNAAVAAAQASSSMKKSSPDVKRKIKNRMQGITGASGRLADKANMSENAWEEIPMMMRQLEFIAYAAEEIMDYVETAGDPEEWFQNKISGIHQSMLSMYAYAQGGRRAGYGFDESVELDEAMTKAQQRALQSAKAQPKEKVSLKKAPWEKNEELKGGQKKLDHNKNGKIDAHDFKLMRSKKMKEDLDEAKDDVDAKWLVTWRKEQSAGKYIDASAFFPTEREARDYKGRLKSTRGVLRNSPEMKKIKQTEADKRALAKESFDLDEAAPKMKPDFLKTQREKDREHNAAMGRTPTGRKKPMTSTQKSMASIRKEEFGQIDEISNKTLTRYAKSSYNDVLKRRSNREPGKGDESDPKIGQRLKMNALAHEKGAFKEEVELDEVSKSLTTRYLDKARSQRGTGKDREKSIGLAYRKSTPGKRASSGYDTEPKVYAKEEVESLDEAFKQGIVKLKDGSSVAIKKEDADLLNQMFKDLSANNRKKMEEVAMKDKSGFEEILGFAREAL